MLSVSYKPFMLSVVKLNVIIVSVIILSVVNTRKNVLATNTLAYHAAMTEKVL
jgi:hypothetical protein